MELKEKLEVGNEIVIEIAPTEGEYSAETVDGTPFIEKFSEESMLKVIENWKADGSKDIRVDLDHSSIDSNDTIAAGWINNLYVDTEAKRLKGTLVVSEKGAEVLNGLDYRYISPVFYFQDDNYPYFLESCGLTNTPRLKELAKVYNSENLIVNNNTKDLNIMEISKLIELLGLPAEATEDDIVGAINELKDYIKNAEDEKAAEEARIAEETLEKEAEELANACGCDDDEVKNEVKNSFKQNKELTVKLVNIYKNRIEKTIVNSAEAVKPELTNEQKMKIEYDSLKGGQEKVDFLMSHKGIKF